jgi:lipid A 3-O-deacylase
VLLLCYPLKGVANIGVTASVGQNIHSVTTYRLGWLNDGLGDSPPPRWQTLWESSIAFWHGTHPKSDRLLVLATSPLLRWQYTGLCHIAYIEAGIGVAWLSRHQIMTRQLSLHFQFEDRVGLGIRLGKRYQYDLSYRYFHYSNGSLKRPNNGINLHLLNLGIWLN